MQTQKLEQLEARMDEIADRVARHRTNAARERNKFGSTLPRALGKRSDPANITKALQGRIDEVVADTGATRCEALRALRKSGERYW